MATETQCPLHAASGVMSNRDWWPNQLNLKILHQHSCSLQSMGKDFNYATEFKSLDLAAVRTDLLALMIRLREYGGQRFRPLRPLFIRMAGTGPARPPNWRRSRRRRRAVDSGSRALHELAGQRPTCGQGRVGCSGRQYRRSANSWADLAELSSPATSPWNRWASRPSGSAAGARTSGNRKRSTGVPEASGLLTSGTPATGTSKIPLAAVQMRLTTSTRKARMATRTRSRRPRTSAKPSCAWR